MLSRSAAEAGPSAESKSVGIWITWRTVWPGISTSAKPTAEAVSGGSVSSVVASMVSRSVWNVLFGKVRVCPAST
jgi:hypothetical protein